MTVHPLRFGLIGTGRIGRIHARNIAAAPEATLAWVCDPMIEAATSVGEAFGARVTDSSADILDPSRVDAVVVASPTSTHLDLIAGAVTAGVPVLCEKPVDLDVKRVERLRSHIVGSGVPVTIGFNRRFDPSIAAARARAVGGDVGAIEQLTIVSRDPAPPSAAYIATAGGLFRDMTIHDLDLARFFVGPIVEVTARGAILFDDSARQHGDYDTAALTLRAESGALVSIINSRHSATGYDQRLEVFGAAGVLQVRNAHTSLVSLSTAASTEARDPYQAFFLERYADSYERELAAFIRLVRDGRSDSPTFDDAHAALVLADAADTAASTGTSLALPAT
jgi:myo-inositol 2-dehydrogenase/D-chiro-inositol 1-dehydrogenase